MQTMSEFLFVFVPILLIGIAFSLIIFTLSKIIKNDSLDKNLKTIWILIILMLPFIGVVAYLLINTSHKK